MNEDLLAAAEARWEALKAGRKLALIALLALAFTYLVFG